MWTISLQIFVVEFYFCRKNFYMLKKEYVDRISNEPLLFGKVAEISNRKPTSILYWIREKQYDKFCTLPILEVIKEHVGAKTVEELVEKAA